MAITGDCNTCEPCEGCTLDLCDECDPCSSPDTCAYCGNGFCRCDAVIDSDEGVMHEGCAAKYKAKEW
jgi:hypothetical protein